MNRSTRAKDAGGRARNRAPFLSQRRKMMAVLADDLDILRTDSNVVPMRRNA